MSDSLPAQTTTTTFAIPTGGVALQAPREITEQVGMLAPDWPPATPAGARQVVLNVHRDADGWRIDGPDYAVPDQVYREGYELANGLVGAMSACYLAADPTLMCLHAAAVAGPNGLIVLLGQNFAGKSTLASALAALGMPLFCDDRLLVRWDGVAMAQALGVATKLRLPLPESASAELRTFVDRLAVWRTADFAILDGPGEARARFGDRQPLVALLLLEREPGTKVPSLASLPRPQAVRALLQHHFAPHVSTDILLQACTALATAVPARSFRYDDLNDGATALLDSLAGGAIG